jgi:hypothetical protein
VISRACHQNCAEFYKLFKQTKNGQWNPEELSARMDRMKALDQSFQEKFPEAERIEAINFYMPGPYKKPSISEGPAF